MAEPLKIPKLDDPFLMELSVCGMLRTKVKKTLLQLRKFEERPTAPIERQDPMTLYLEVFGGGAIKNHIHVNVIPRPKKWKPRGPLKKLEEIKVEIEKFYEQSLDLRITGEFFVAISELSPGGIVRSAMTEKKTSGLTVKQTGQRLNFGDAKGDGIEGLIWTSSQDEKYVNVYVRVRSSSVIGPEYLCDAEATVIRAFRALIQPEKSNVATD